MSPSSPGSQRSTGLGSSVRCDCQGSWHRPGDGTPSTTGKAESLGGKEEDPDTTNLNPGTGLPGLGINAHAITDIQKAAHPSLPGVRRPIQAPPSTGYGSPGQLHLVSWSQCSPLSNQENDPCTVKVTRKLSQTPLERVNIHLFLSQK